MMSNESSLSQMSESAMSSDDAGFDSSLDPGSGYTLFESMLIAVIAGILSFLTIAGNVLVMVSFKLDKQLQTISNYFLLSLAVADFMIGLISMPLYTTYIILNKWPLGPFVCDAWLALDYLNSNASVLNLLIISFDRYFSVTRPLTYRVRRTTRRACLMIASTWIISLLLWPPWIFAWPYIEGKRTVPETMCYIQFLETNLYITFGTALAAFYIPVSVMCFLYWRIWRETEKRYKDLTTLFLVSAVGSSKVKSAKMKNGSGAAGGSSKKAKSIMISASGSSAAAGKDKGKSGRKLLSVTSRASSREGDQQHKQEIANPADQEDEASNCRSYCQRSSSAHHSLIHLLCYPLIYVYDRFISPSIDVDDEEDEDDRSSVRKAVTGKDGTDMTSTTEEDENALTDTDCDSSKAGTLASDSIYTILITLGIPGSKSAAAGGGGYHINTPTTTSSAALTPIEESFDEKSHHSIKQFFESAVIKECRSRSGSGGSSSGARTRLSSTGTTTTTTTAAAAASASTLTRVQSTMHRPVVQSAISQPKAEKKAAKTLSAILLTFIITWTPYNVLVLIKTLSDNSVAGAGSLSMNGTIASNATSLMQDAAAASSSPLIPESLYSFAYYLCYINSTINPFCYALCNVNFRNTYLRILRCQWTLRGTRAKRAAANLEAQFTHDLHARSKKSKQQQQQQQTAAAGGGTLTPAVMQIQSPAVRKQKTIELNDDADGRRGNMGHTGSRNR